MELRFELERLRQESARLRRRCVELQSARELARLLPDASMSAGTTTTTSSSSSSSSSRAAGERFRRERDLEGVVDQLKRVVDKQKTELERLRRGVSSSSKAVAQARR